MNKKIYIILTVVLTLGLLAGCSNTQLPDSEQTVAVTESAANPPAPTMEISDPGFGAAGSFDNPDLDLEQMLVYAIQDEYLARAEYEYLINELNAGNPFVNIIKAEEKHISMLIPLFEAYGFDVPEDTSTDHIISVESITSALETGVQAEIDNIAMYEQFLEGDLPEDVRDIFVELRDASKNHLEAFKRKLSR